MGQNFEFRKVVSANRNASLCINLPKNYTENLAIEKGDTVKVQLNEDYVTIRKVKENE